MGQAEPVNIAIVVQEGRLAYEALLFAASLALTEQSRPYQLFAMEPQPGPLWTQDPRLQNTQIRTALETLGAQFVPFQSTRFGESYPHGNKIEGLSALPKDAPFVFFDTDTLILDDLARVPFDFDRPGASLRRENTWPKPDLYGPDLDTIWRSLYAAHGLDFASSLDESFPVNHWRRYLYFNAGLFFYRCPHVFGTRFLDTATAIRDTPPAALAGQTLDPWLDQVALPLVVHGLGGGRRALPDGLIDGTVSCHYRTIPLLYARESDKAIWALEAAARHPAVASLLNGYQPLALCVHKGRGADIKAMFPRDGVVRKEHPYRARLKREGLWLR